VLESHQPLRLCRPPPELLGQRDAKSEVRAAAFASARAAFLLASLNRVSIEIEIGVTNRIRTGTNAFTERDAAVTS